MGGGEEHSTFLLPYKATQVGEKPSQIGSLYFREKLKHPLSLESHFQLICVHLSQTLTLYVT
jgi:hypothetical protein